MADYSFTCSVMERKYWFLVHSIELFEQYLQAYPRNFGPLIYKTQPASERERERTIWQTSGQVISKSVSQLLTLLGHFPPPPFNVYMSNLRHHKVSLRSKRSCTNPKSFFRDRRAFFQHWWGSAERCKHACRACILTWSKMSLLFVTHIVTSCIVWFCAETLLNVVRAQFFPRSDFF